MEPIKKYVENITEFLTESTPDEKLPNVDTIFVFGHYEPLVARQAVKLWKKGKAPCIVISGKGRDKIPKGFETEADFYAFLIKSEGVPQEALILERKSTNSLENVILGINICHEKGMDIQSLIICSMPPLLRRSRATFKKQFPNIKVYGSTFDIPNEWFTSRRIIRLMEEVDRLKEYSKKGDIVSVNIPQKVIFAVEKIKLYYSRA